MPLILQTAVKENLAQRVEVQWDSYGDDPVISSLMTGVSPQERREMFTREMNKESDYPYVKDLEVIDTDTGYDSVPSFLFKKTSISEHKLT